MTALDDARLCGSFRSARNSATLPARRLKSFIDVMWKEEVKAWLPGSQRFLTLEPLSVSMA